VRSARYVLRARSGGWDGGRLVRFDLTAEREGRPLGGHNVQAVVGMPDEPRYGLDADVAMWLPSGWWVTLRNQFADAPDVALAIIRSAADLSSLTTEAATLQGRESHDLWRRLLATPFESTGLDYWR
jgi:hypothetical protein